MILFHAFVTGKEKEGKYFTNAREAYDYIGSLDIPNNECEIVAVDIPALEIPE